MTPIQKIEMVLPSLRMHEWHRGRQKGKGRCPNHDDKEPSLSVAETADGTVLLKCFAGCPTSEVLRAINLQFKDLFARSR